MIVEWLYYKAATCSAIVKCDLMHPLWVSILRGLYLGQNSPSRLQLGRHLSLIIVIFLFGLRKWNYYSALSLPTPLFSKVCIYIHVNCGLLIISNKMVTYQEPKGFYSTCVSNLIQAFHGEGLILAQAVAAKSQDITALTVRYVEMSRRPGLLVLLPSANRWGASLVPKSWGYTHHHIPPLTFSCPPRIVLLHIWALFSSLIFTHQQGWTKSKGFRGN